MFNKLIRILLITTLLLTIQPAPTSHADSLVVNTTDDVLDAAIDCASVTPDLLPGGDGMVSLREAMCAANNNPGEDTITFQLMCIGDTCRFVPLIALPVITDSYTTIDGGGTPATDTGPADFTIEIDGTNVTHNNGFTITSSNNVIKGLLIHSFGLNGVAIAGADAADNVIAGNHIGTGVFGTERYGNGLNGVFIGLGAHDNLIGGDEPAERNIIADSTWEGVGIHGPTTTANVVSGNFIGTNAAASIHVGNTLYGVRIYGGAHHNTIGGDTPGERNVISGNFSDGVRIAGVNSDHNTVTGNFIGTKRIGLDPLVNADFGVYITGGAQYNAIGGDQEAERNIIASNIGGNVGINGSGTMSNTVSGNYIGVGVDGTTPLGSDRAGVEIWDGAQNNTIGGRLLYERNVIADNIYGVIIRGSVTAGNRVIGNFIGTDATGHEELGNFSHGVVLSEGATGNFIGGSSTGAGNVISGNHGGGVSIQDIGTDNNLVAGNMIGTGRLGIARLPNVFQGVAVTFGASDNIIGGAAPGAGNLISGNAQDGVHIIGPFTGGNQVLGNFIGTDYSGNQDLGNSQSGVNVHGSANNVIGGDSPGEGNLISGNGYDGLYVTGDGSDGNVITGNYIGTNISGTLPLGNDEAGIFIGFETKDTLIGGDTRAAGNLISANRQGVYMSCDLAEGTRIANNYIGTDINAAPILGNYLYGINGGLIHRTGLVEWSPDNGIHNGSYNTLIEANIIAGNGEDGIYLACSDKTVIIQNSILANELGIYLDPVANGGIAPPVITATDVGSVIIRGTACPGCTVEFFENHDDDGEGETYIGQALADTAGDFSLELRILHHPYLTATATDEALGTSMFSDVFVATFIGGNELFMPFISIGE